MASDDFENGVWRTIGGRHIFIRDGESVSSAMKRSGKFKSAKKVKKEDHTFKMNDEEKKKYEEVGKKIDNLTKEIDEKNNEKEAERIQDGKSNDEIQLVNMGDGKYIPVRKGEKVEDVVKQFNEREKNYREGLKAHVYDLVSGRVAGPWDQDVVDAYIEMNEKGMFTGDYKDLITRDMKNMGGEPIYSPDRIKQSNELKEINDKIANNKTLTEEEYTKKIREIQSRPSYKQKMDEAVSELNKKYDGKEKTSNEKYSVDYFKQRGVEIKDKIPEGYVKLEGATTAPNGYEWYSNGKSRFGGEYKNALVKTQDSSKATEIKVKGDTNVIPRDFEKGYGRFKVETNSNKGHLDDRYEITKDENGYHAKNLRTGETYATFRDHLSNNNVFEFENEKKPNDTINNTIRRKAYQKYLKEHPTSKMTFEDFKDMSKMQ